MVICGYFADREVPQIENTRFFHEKRYFGCIFIHKSLFWGVE
mgnify:CR=1 FL=1